MIAVAILTTLEFDAAIIAPASVDFEGASPVHDALQDLDEDGDLDLIMHFRTRDTNIAEDATEACLTGETTGGQPVEGCDTIRIVPPEMDTDGDSQGLGTPPFFGDAVEASIGAGQFDGCPATAIANDEPVDAWAPDFNDTRMVDSLDAFLLASRFGSAITLTADGRLPYLPRFDLNADGGINVLDMFIFARYFNKTCS